MIISVLADVGQAHSSPSEDSLPGIIVGEDGKNTGAESYNLPGDGVPRAARPDHFHLNARAIRQKI